MPKADRDRMRTGVDRERPDEPEGEVEFFGFKLTVRSPQLAALLNSSAADDVRLVADGAAEAAALEAAEPAVLRVPAHRDERLEAVGLVVDRDDQ